MHTPPLARLRARHRPQPPTTRWLPTFLVLGVLWLLMELATRF